MSKLLALLGVSAILVTIITLVLFKGRLLEGLGQKFLPVKKVEIAKVDKSEANWLENYCLKEVKSLPEAPFKFTKKDVHTRSRTSASDIYLRKYIPDNKWFKAQTCVIWYDFEYKEAYASVGVEYIFDIKAVNTFEENTDTLYTKAIDKGWKKISPLSDKESGRPNYTYDGMPMVFTRENKDVGTEEYATVNFGPRVLYVHFIAYEK